MTRDDAEEYTQSLGQIAVGSWRLIAWAKKQGVPEALGMTTEEWVRGRLGGYVRLSIEDRREAVKNLTDEGLTTREIGEVVGTSHVTVADDVKNLTPREKYEAEIAEGCTVDDLSGLIGSKKFGTIYADPPWLYDNQGTRAATKNHYDGLTVSELCELPLRELAADDAHLHLWTTNAFLFECPRLFDAWGFEFRSSYVWAKPQMGIGNYWRNSHEFLLTAIRGNAKRFNDHSLMSWGSFDRTKHSSKPEQVRQFIERASPGPYLELFARRSAPNWTVWGNQIERGLFEPKELAS